MQDLLKFFNVAVSLSILFLNKKMILLKKMWGNVLIPTGLINNDMHPLLGSSWLYGTMYCPMEDLVLVLSETALSKVRVLFAYRL